MLEVHAGEKLYVVLADVDGYVYRVGLLSDVGRLFLFWLPRAGAHLVHQPTGRVAALGVWYPHLSVLPMGLQLELLHCAGHP